MEIVSVIGLSKNQSLEVTEHIAIKIFKVERLQLVFNSNLKLEVS